MCNVRRAINQYIMGQEFVDSNPQLRINPETSEVILVNGSDFLEEIADNDEAIENAAHAQGRADEEALDNQVAENPDFYAVEKLVVKDESGRMHPDEDAIRQLAESYFL